MGDLLFAEGALLLLAGGLADLAGSITLSRIGALPRTRGDAPPPAPRKPWYRYRLLVAGLLLCLQGALLALF